MILQIILIMLIVTNMSLSTLPTEIQCVIACNLPYNSLISLRLTNKSWYELGQSKLYWHVRYVQDFGQIRLLLFPDHVSHEQRYHITHDLWSNKLTGDRALERVSSHLALLEKQSETNPPSFSYVNLVKCDKSLPVQRWVVCNNITLSHQIFIQTDISISVWSSKDGKEHRITVRKRNDNDKVLSNPQDALQLLRDLINDGYWAFDGPVHLNHDSPTLFYLTLAN